MSLFSRFKTFFGHFFLKKELQKVNRIRKPAGFNRIKTVGILYLVPEENNFPFITDFVKFLQDNGKIVKALGFTNTDYVPHYCFPKLTYDYISKKHVNWYGKPQHKLVEDFINNDFDLLIDLNTDKIFTLNFIGYVSVAKFKVGLMNEDNIKHYDLMMNVKDDILLSDYIPQIKHYLTNLNITTNEQNV